MNPLSYDTNACLGRTTHKPSRMLVTTTMPLAANPPRSRRSVMDVGRIRVEGKIATDFPSPRLSACPPVYGTNACRGRTTNNPSRMLVTTTIPLEKKG